MVSDSHVRRSLGGIVGILGALTLIFAALNGVVAASAAPGTLLYFVVDGVVALATMAGAILFIRRMTIGYYLVLGTLLAAILLRVAPLAVGDVPPIFWTVLYVGAFLYALLSHSLLDDSNAERHAEAIDPHGGTRR